MNGTSRQARPSSEQVRDLHVYVIPPELWRQHLRSAANEVITDSISLGFLRISPHTYLHELRHEIVEQLGDDYLPKDYAFLKSVGRCLTQVKSRQEREIKAKHFLPPYAYAPELFILDAHAESMRDSPSTIFQQSLSGSNSARHPNDDQPSYKYPSSLGNTSSPRPHRQNRDPADDNLYNSQVFDQRTGQPLTKSSYPTYSQPYSHDISALTNAHRNQVDNSVDSDSHYGKGGTTYRKYNDDSSGYRSMPSPRKLSESPPRVRGGDNSSTKKDSSRYDDSPDPQNSRSPRRVQRNDTEIIDAPAASRYRDDRDSSNSVSPERRRGQPPSHGNSPERYHKPLDEQKSGGSDTSMDSKKIQDIRLDDAEGHHKSHSDYDRQTADREMMSATPNASPPIRKNNRDVQEPEREQSQYVLRKSRSPNKSSTNQRDDDETDESNEEKREILRELKQAKAERLTSEKRREELVKKARSMQAKTNNRRNQAREVWKKKYYEAKKLTPSLEIECQKLRAELDSIHKKYLTVLENSTADGKTKENHQLDAAKLQYEVDELQRKADAAKMKLTAEMKLRNQAETELRALRAELTQKKMNMNLSRAQKMNSIGNSALTSS